MGSYTRSLETPDQFLTINLPSLVLDASDDAVHDPPPSMVAIELSEPFFATEFAINELCSTDELSPSLLRMSCLGQAARVIAIEVRIDQEAKSLFMTIDGIARDPIIFARNVCVSLESRIPQRSLTQLQKTFLNDNLSARCSSALPRRTVPATFIREVLPPGHDLYELGKLRCTDLPSPHCCRNVTDVRLKIPQEIGISPNLGLLEQQCGSCRTINSRVPNGAIVECSDLILTSVGAFQLGDYLYFTYDDRVRRIPLSCGTILDFRVTEFIPPL